MIKTINVTNTAIDLTWADNSQSKFPFIWLRDIDPLGFHPQTAERLFDLTKVSIEIAPTDVEFKNEQLSLQWPGEAKRSVFSAKLLASYAVDCQLQDAAEISYARWGSDFNIQRFSANNFEQENPEQLKAMLSALKRDGLVIINGLQGELGGEQFGDLIGFKRETNFGVMFEVINKADPNNLAYTAVELPLHTDLTNQQLPPGYQFLHCIKNDAQGGESLLADGFAIAEDLRSQNSDNYQRLCQQKMPFRFHDKSCDLRYKHSLISEENGVIKNFIFNAHLAESANLIDGQNIDFYSAYQDLMRRIRSPQYALQLKLQAGEMMIFDNGRVLHGRSAFDPTTGDRHLRGYYIDHCEVDSKIRMLANAE
ncbi:MAG: gamma-butyrobetaine dioxygenase [Oceanospirillaceae bacterium]|jgi:gamma-butyrobetaine dioxygenase